MTPRAVLLKAARLIDEGKEELCCLAIDSAANSHSYYELIDYFCNIFSPYGYVGTGMPFWSDRATPERQQLRVICLLFAAWSYPDEPTA